MYEALAAGVGTGLVQGFGVPARLLPNLLPTQLQSSPDVAATAVAVTAQTIQNPGFQAAAETTALKLGGAALALDVAEFGSHVIPVVGWVVTGAQAIYATYQGANAYRNTFDSCMAK